MPIIAAISAVFGKGYIFTYISNFVDKNQKVFKVKYSVPKTTTTSFNDIMCAVSLFTL